uniref:HORMA domain-containing protein n=1 Tax=Macrostomum lignano TaxID=282301 RepID=A0A1I8HI72_9PLAT
YAVNSILYQRGIYPSESFSFEQKYGLTVLVTSDEKLKAYLIKILEQVKQWLSDLVIEKLVLVIRRVSTQEVVERWQFDIKCDKSAKSDEPMVAEKDEKQVKKDIADVIRQIVASVTFLPALDFQCSFELLIYCDKNTELPSGEWADTGPQLVSNSVEVKLKSFTTSIHKVDSLLPRAISI